MTRHDSELICVGHVSAAQGLKGWVRVISRTSPRENIANYNPWLLPQDGDYKTVDVEVRQQGKHILARLQGVEDRNQAEALIGSELFIRAEQLPELAPGDYYWSDLIGMAVENLDAESLGIVESMMETGAHDVLVLKGDRQRLVPFVIDDIVRSVDLEQRRIVIDWGLDY